MELCPSSVKRSSGSGALINVSLHVGNVWASLVAQMIKNLPAVQETQFRSLGQENFLEKGMANHSSILALGNPMNRGTWHVTV